MTTSPILTGLHSFTIYALVGVGLGWLAAVAASRRFPAMPAGSKRALWMIPLAAPVAVVFLAWAGERAGIFNTCPPIALFGPGPAGVVWDWLCAAGVLLAGILWPFFGLAVVGGLGKAAASLVLAARVGRAAGRGSSAADAEWQRVRSSVGRMSERLGLRRPAFLVAGAVPGVAPTRPASPAFPPSPAFPASPAFTAGLWRPVVVLSRELVAGLDDLELDAAVAHELAHIAAGDHRRKWLLVTLRDILFFTGLAGAAYRQAEAAMEDAADGRATVAVGQPLALAGALLKARRLVANAGHGLRRPTPALDHFAPSLAADGVIARVERLVRADGPAEPSRAPAAWSLLAVGLWVVVVFVSLSVC